MPDKKTPHSASSVQVAKPVASATKTQSFDDAQDKSVDEFIGVPKGITSDEGRILEQNPIEQAEESTISVAAPAHNASQSDAGGEKTVKPRTTRAKPVPSEEATPIQSSSEPLEAEEVAPSQDTPVTEEYASEQPSHKGTNLPEALPLERGVSEVSQSFVSETSRSQDRNTRPGFSQGTTPTRDYLSGGAHSVGSRSSSHRGPARPRQGRFGQSQSYNGGQQRSTYNDRNARPDFNRFSTPQPVESAPTEIVTGYLDVQPEGHGFLRPKFIPSNRDIYISQSQIRRFMLRGGDKVEGVARPPKDSERYYGLLKVEKINDKIAEESVQRPWFDDLTPIYPKDMVKLATGKTPLSTRIIDLVAPIGFGQRGMIVSPPKAGKTTILKDIAAGISANFPEVHLMAALIGERPEEVTDISMSVKGEVVASNFDEAPEHQTKVAEITLERAKRMVEEGKDVVVLLDSITRLARAYNLAVAPSGRTLSGGFDPAALHPAKKFFGAARNCQEGGSLTIIGTALVETGSRLDDLVYEEFKGTGNMELHLERKLAERRIYPAINVARSGTRQEELILSEKQYKKIVTMRRMIDMLGDDERTSLLIEKLSKTENNEEFLETLGQD